MSIFEQYQADVPLSFPSLDSSLDLIKQGVPLFSEIVFQSQNPDRQPCLFLNRKWLSYSDFYNGTIISNLFEYFEIGSGTTKVLATTRILANSVYTHPR